MQNKLIELFAANVATRTAAQPVGINQNTATYDFHRLRLLNHQDSPYLEILDGKISS